MEAEDGGEEEEYYACEEARGDVASANSSALRAAEAVFGKQSESIARTLGRYSCKKGSSTVIECILA